MRKCGLYQQSAYRAFHNRRILYERILSIYLASTQRIKDCPGTSIGEWKPNAIIICIKKTVCQGFLFIRGWVSRISFRLTRLHYGLEVQCKWIAVLSFIEQ